MVPSKKARTLIDGNTSYLATRWPFQQYGTGQSVHLTSLNGTIEEVRQLYRRLSIPAMVDQVEEEKSTTDFSA